MTGVDLHPTTHPSVSGPVVTVQPRRPGPDLRGLPFTLEEARAAVQALQRGDFRRGPAVSSPAVAGPYPRQRTVLAENPEQVVRTPFPGDGERVVAVVGSAGSTGSSTLALALAMATAAASRTSKTTPPAVRVVECCSASASGLAAASQAELGLHPAGWRQGTRGGVLIERTSQVITSINALPAPTDQTPGLTVLDVGWDTAHLVGTDCWVTSAVSVADQVVVTATATIPGLRRLEATLQLLSDALGIAGRPESTDPQPDPGVTPRTGLTQPLARMWVAVLGPRRRRWPRGVERAAGPLVSQMLAAGRLIEVPEDRALASHGLDSRPLPPPVLAAVERLLPGPRPVHTDPHHRGRAAGYGNPPDQQVLFDGPA